MTWRSRVRTSLVYLVSMVAGFSLAWLIVAFVVFPAGVVPRDVKVPNVTGLMYDEASQRLAQAGFKTEQGESRYTASAPKMTVLEQSPPPGAREGIGGTITLVVSGGQRTATVPAVTGMTRIEAQALLEKDGFDIGDVGEANSNAPRGTVIATRPAAGSQVSVPSSISLVLSWSQRAVMTSRRSSATRGSQIFALSLALRLHAARIHTTAVSADTVIPLHEWTIAVYSPR